jgi:hypothetical protein
MEDVKLKKYLLQIADKITADSTLEDVYEQLALLADIDESEMEEKSGATFSQKEVKEVSTSWLM